MENWSNAQEEWEKINMVVLKKSLALWKTRRPPKKSRRTVK